MRFLCSAVLMTAFFALFSARAETPNIIFILSDDLAMGDVGCYGQKLIKTPNLDRMAAEGTRYMQAYSGTTVCAPSRSSLMTGLDMGHCPIRGNVENKTEGQKPLPPGTTTVASVLKKAGYATGCFGKWGMGMFNTSGSPLKVGFDRFYGYNCQRHAHTYYPSYLYDNDKRVELDGSTYADQLIQKQALDFIREHHKKPFFLYYATTLPHTKLEIDDVGIYSDKPWSEAEKIYAAMVSRLDSNIGEVLQLLRELGIEKNTLVITAGDNGSSFNPNSPIGKRFDQSMGGKLRGFKRSPYEGGLRQAAISWWPETIPAGRVSDEPWAFWDFLPTVAELVGQKLTSPTQGHSLVNYLKGASAPKRPYFYWELHEGKPFQVVRFGDWKAIRNREGTLELYDLANDLAEQRNLADKKPDLVAKAEQLMEEARDDNPEWKLGEKKRK